MLKPIIILCTISTVLSLLFSNNLLDFAKYFLAATLIQVILYNVYKSIIEYLAMKLQVEKIKEYSKQGMEVKCPCYLEKKMFVPITLNGENVFNCNECDKMISVDITAKTFMQTDMIDLDKADEALIKAYKHIQNNS
jgi:hypothetical protein